MRGQRLALVNVSSFLGKAYVVGMVLSEMLADSAQRLFEERSGAGKVDAKVALARNAAIERATIDLGVRPLHDLLCQGVCAQSRLADVHPCEIGALVVHHLPFWQVLTAERPQHFEVVVNIEVQRIDPVFAFVEAA